ncbi:phBC6A51 family helix-turn-helix protein [Radiobacillus sp. PE A8.2]|uniref:phBC6A51 family helix-turn-helix protein n=1 Tax=Radiobacillus sp. PE A8.2 TaxID=3380349 RepID=UPI00388DA525
MTEEKLPHNKEAAAQLLASGSIEKQHIADQLGISRTTLWAWEKNDENFKARVDELKREFESFGIRLIESKLVDAVNEYWKLIKATDNARVAADGYRYFIDRKLGKPTSKHEIDTGIVNSTVDDDVLDVEYDQLEHEAEED